MAALVTTTQAAQQTIQLPMGGYVTVDPNYDLPQEPSAENVGIVRWYDENGILLTYIQGSTANDQVGSGGITVMNEWYIAVSSPLWDNAGAADAGAVTIISPPFSPGPPITTVSATNSMVGSSPGDQVGSGGITLMNEWSVLVCSPLWDNSGAANAGAATIMTTPGTGGVSTGAVSATNSLVGSSAGDQVGSGGVTVVDAFSILIRSPLWDNAGAADAGALTILGSPVPDGVFNGAVSATNSLVGSSADDQIGSGGVTVVDEMSVVVHSPLWDNGGAADAGAVTILAPGFGIASKGALSATNSLVGSSAGDQVGSGGVTSSDGSIILVHSPLWDNGGAADAGAVTILAPWFSPPTVGVVSATNSLVGSSAGDQIGSGGVTVLDQAGILVHSPLWDNSGAGDAGAVTILAPWLGPPTVGVVSATNSLVGSSTGDQIGSGGVTVLNEAGILVRSPLWDNGVATEAGAVTILPWPGFGFFTKGVVSATNSLVGSSADDQIGSGGVTVLNEAGILVRSPLWDNSGATDAGAVTTLPWPGFGFFTNGALSATNSWVGSSAGDQIGSGGFTVVNKAGILVHSPLWDNGGVADAGAVTTLPWPGFFFPTNGVVSASNSLVGSSAGDQVGSGGATALNEASVLVCSPLWDNSGVADAGAVTSLPWPWLGPPTSGAVSANNSLVGSSAGDQVGSGGVTLAEGLGYLVLSPLWDNGTTADVGAVTLWSTAGGPPTLVGTVSTANSLVGASAHDQVGSGGATVLGSPETPQGYAIRSPLWDNVSVADAGALTLGGFPWEPPSLVGTVSTSNSLVGASTGDDVGSGGVLLHGVGALVLSPLWDNGTAGDAGAATFFPLYTGPPTVGVISSGNSLVGSSPNDRVGSGFVTPFGFVGLVIHSPLWDNGAAVEAGAITVIDGSPGMPPPTGVISSANSLVGSSANDQVGSGGITPLGSSNDSFVLRSPLWDNGAAADAGAVTVVTPLFHTGTLSADNSMVGFSANDQVGSGGIARVGTDSFVVSSPQWDDGAVVNAGAATFGGLQAPFKGPVFALNSIVGSAANDQVGSGGVWAASSTVGLVSSPLWDHRTAIDAGAVTCMSNSDFALSHPVTTYNSLVGSHSNDQIGSGGITVQQTSPLVVIHSPNWCYGAGATTSLSTVPFGGFVSRANSMTGVENAEPEFALLQPAPVEVAAGSLQSFGNVEWGGSRSLTFTIKNKGMDDLVLYNMGGPIVALTGMDRSQFSLVGDTPWETSFPVLILVAGDSATFSVQFSPTSAGTKTATMSIHQYTGPSSTAFSVSLTGTGDAVTVTDWRQTHFGSSANMGTGADSADYDNDGIPNLVEYALGLHPTQSTTAQLPRPVRSGGNFTLSVTQPGSVGGIIYGAEWSTTLAGGSWLPVTDTGAAPQHVFSVPIGANKKMFMRLKVTATP